MTFTQNPLIDLVAPIAKPQGITFTTFSFDHFLATRTKQSIQFSEKIIHLRTHITSHLTLSMDIPNREKLRKFFELTY